MTYKDYLTEIFYTKINRTYISRVTVAVHNRDQLIRDITRVESIEYQLKNSLITEYYFEYKKTIIKSLPKPYDTDCYDYRGMGYKSLTDCIDKCRINAFIEKIYNLWPGAYLQYNESMNSKIVNIFQLFQENPELDQTLAKHCKKLCGHRSDCNQEIFELKIKPRFITSDGFFIVFFPQNTPDIIYTHSPKILFEEFVSYIASYVSLWFGFSIIMLSNVIHKCYQFINYKMNYYMRIFKINNKIQINLNSQNIHINSTIQNNNVKLTGIVPEIEIS